MSRKIRLLYNSDWQILHDAFDTCMNTNLYSVGILLPNNSIINEFQDKILSNIDDSWVFSTTSINGANNVLLKYINGSTVRLINNMSPIKNLIGRKFDEIFHLSCFNEYYVIYILRWGIIGNDTLDEIDMYELNEFLNSFTIINKGDKL